MNEHQIFNFNASASKIDSISELDKRGLEYRNHELLETNGTSKRFFSEPSNIPKRIVLRKFYG